MHIPLESPGGPMHIQLLLLLEVPCPVDYCFSWSTHAQSTRACSASLSVSQRDRRLLAHKSAWEVYRKLTWEQYYRHRRSIHCAHSRGTVTLILAPLWTSQVPLIAVALLTVHSLRPLKRLISTRRCTTNRHSSCPLNRHISNRRCTTNRHSSCQLKRQISTRVALLTVHSSYRPKRHTEPCHGTPLSLGAHSTLPLKRPPLLVTWKLTLSFCFSSLCYLCRPSDLLCLFS